MRCSETKITRRKLTSVLPLSYSTAVIEKPEGETSLRLQAVRIVKENSTAALGASALLLRGRVVRYHSRISMEASANRMASAVAFSRSGMGEYELKTDLRQYNFLRWANFSREFMTDQPGTTRPEKKTCSGQTVYPPYTSITFVREAGVW